MAMTTSRSLVLAISGRCGHSVSAPTRALPGELLDRMDEGWNTATCARDRSHAPPDPGCRCGFYVYAHPSYALAQAPARQVMAVVAVHGALEAGTRGARAEKARIEAVWLGDRVSDDLAGAVQQQAASGASAGAAWTGSPDCSESRPGYAAWSSTGAKNVTSGGSLSASPPATCPGPAPSPGKEPDRPRGQHQLSSGR
jgi:hypothetical protein